MAEIHGWLTVEKIKWAFLNSLSDLYEKAFAVSSNEIFGSGSIMKRCANIKIGIIDSENVYINRFLQKAVGWSGFELQLKRSGLATIAAPGPHGHWYTSSGLNPIRTCHGQTEDRIRSSRSIPESSLLRMATPDNIVTDSTLLATLDCH
jgi:hypothetical protein